MVQLLPQGSNIDKLFIPLFKRIAKRWSAVMPWAAVDLSRGGRCPELTRNGFSRARTDNALADVLTGGQRHPLRWCNSSLRSQILRNYSSLFKRIAKWQHVFMPLAAVDLFIGVVDALN
jgi:hypothetical protein